MALRLHDRILAPDDRPLVMGILNVTPDSFSDGGDHSSVDRAVARAWEIHEAGADILDVGGESTRPGADPVSPRSEQMRVLPVLERLGEADYPMPISVDTRHATTAAAALDRGAHLINDVSALGDAGMAAVIKRTDTPVVLMHMQGDPSTMQQAPAYADDVVGEIMSWLENRIGFAVKQGIARDQIVVDPGIGFGKRTGGRHEDNLRILERLGRFHGLGAPLLVGASRKRFIGNIADVDVDERLPGSLVAAAAAAWSGAHIVRVHDVAETVQALRVAARMDPSHWTAFWSGPTA